MISTKLKIYLYTTLLIYLYIYVYIIIHNMFLPTLLTSYLILTLCLIIVRDVVQITVIKMLIYNLFIFFAVCIFIIVANYNNIYNYIIYILFNTFHIYLINLIYNEYNIININYINYDELIDLENNI